ARASPPSSGRTTSTAGVQNWSTTSRRPFSHATPRSPRRRGCSSTRARATPPSPAPAPPSSACSGTTARPRPHGRRSGRRGAGCGWRRRGKLRLRLVRPLLHLALDLQRRRDEVVAERGEVLVLVHVPRHGVPERGLLPDHRPPLPLHRVHPPLDGGDGFGPGQRVAEGLAVYEGDLRLVHAVAHADDGVGEVMLCDLAEDGGRGVVGAAGVHLEGEE